MNRYSSHPIIFIIHEVHIEVFAAPTVILRQALQSYPFYIKGVKRPIIARSTRQRVLMNNIIANYSVINSTFNHGMQILRGRRRFHSPLVCAQLKASRNYLLLFFMSKFLDSKVLELNNCVQTYCFNVYLSESYSEAATSAALPEPTSPVNYN